MPFSVAQHVYGCDYVLQGIRGNLLITISYPVEKEQGSDVKEQSAFEIEFGIAYFGKCFVLVCGYLQYFICICNNLNTVLISPVDSFPISIS